MARRGDTKTVQVVDNKGTGKSAGAKRATGDSSLEPLSKRLKATASTVKDAVVPEEAKEPVKPWAVDPDQAFRFMELPGELRNRIYEIAAEWSHRCFPMTHRKPKKSRRRKQTPGVEDHKAAVKPLPYMGLTQVCSLIRTEFRPMWLSTHRFPLFALEGYFKAFFPILRRTSQTDDKGRKRIESYHDLAGTLRLWVKKDCMKSIDILPLLKFRLRFPAYTIDVISAHLEIKPRLMNSLTALINNDSSTWIKYISQHSITQVILECESYAGRCLDPKMHLVIKERQMSKWVEPGRRLKPIQVTELKKSLGIADIDWIVHFGVDYW